MRSSNERSRPTPLITDPAVLEALEDEILDSFNACLARDHVTQLCRAPQLRQAGARRDRKAHPVVAVALRRAERHARRHPGHFRDNKVRYVFSHIQELVDAGGLGAAFGTGAGDQTYITTDGDQFKKAVKSYYESPVALP